MGYRIINFLLAFLLSSGVAAAEQAKTEYACMAGGCEIYCKAKRGDWELYDKASVSVVTVNHDNGNVEIFLDNGAMGKQTLLISQANLFCKVKNYK